MIVYWLLLILPALALLSPLRLNASGKKLVWLLYGFVFVVFIGLRDHVGGDWEHYKDFYYYIERLDFWEALRYGDSGYSALNWLMSHWGGNLYLLNTICAVMVMAGVLVFARAQPMPWLALLVAVPYLIVVVAMGYTRQSAALGLAMIGLTALRQQRIVKFVVWVLLGALIHKSAVLLVPIGALAATRNRIWTWMWVAATTAAGAILLLLDDSDTLWKNYVVADYQSQGGFIRVVMNAVPALLLLTLGRRFGVGEDERKLWFWMSIFSLACIPLVLMSSTATDRVALYFIPIQMYAFAHLPRLARTAQGRSAIVLTVMVYYAAVMYVWLNYAASVKWWVPYHFMPL